MSTEVLPMGERCNIRCEYCYQEPIRRAGNEGHPKYNMEAMKATLLAHGQPFSLFGGEPLLVPKRDLEELWKFGLEKFKPAQQGGWVNSIQTNGTLIDVEHLNMFEKYKVGVGVSVDGPGELNDSRWAGDEATTRKLTANTQWAIVEMLRRNIPMSIIVTLNRFNAAPDRVPRLTAWLQDLADRGLTHVNLHLLQANDVKIREQMGLTPEENVEAILACGRLMATTRLQVMPLTDILRLLKGEDNTTCTWNACDSYATQAVFGVDGQGHIGNCGRTCKQGPHWIKADQSGFERYLGLYYTPQEYNGCQGCRFFYACKGHCPGEGMEEQDWRSKSEHCPTLMSLFERVERQMIDRGEVPISISPRRVEAEEAYLQAWKHGRTINLSMAIKGPVKMSETGHTDIPERPHLDTPHIDTPHIDHNDAARPNIEHNDHNDGGGPWATL